MRGFKKFDDKAASSNLARFDSDEWMSIEVRSSRFRFRRREVKATVRTVVIVASIIALALVVSVKKFISFISFNRYTCLIERL